MAYTTKPTAATLFQMSVALAFFLAVCMARNIANYDLDIVKPTELTSQEIPGMPPMPSSQEPADPEPNTGGCSKTYNVKKGETCYLTWTRFKVKEKTFYALNPGIDCDNLDIGQALCIAGDAGGDLPKPDKPALPELPALPPSAEPAYPEPNTSGCSKTYNVKKGETCYSTWTRFKVKEKAFYALNPGIDCDNLNIGQALCIAGDAGASGDLPKPDKPELPVLPELPALPPATEPVDPMPNTSGCSKTYNAKKGETCYSTWTRFKVNEKTFYVLNPDIDCDNLDIGQALCIAGDAGASGDIPKSSKPELSVLPDLPALPPSTEPANPEPNTIGCNNTYNVKKGETCYSTWTKFKLKEKTFYALNPGIDCDNLDIGQALCIAGSAN